MSESTNTRRHPALFGGFSAIGPPLALLTSQVMRLYLDLPNPYEPWHAGWISLTGIITALFLCPAVALGCGVYLLTRPGLKGQGVILSLASSVLLIVAVVTRPA